MIEREQRSRRSVTVDAEPIEDGSLTWQARGLLVYLLSKPDHWRTDRNHLATQAPNGLSAVRSILAELELAGYLTRERVRADGGRWSWKHVIHERAVPPNQRTSGGKSASGATSKNAGQTSGRFTAGGQAAAIGSNGRPRVTDTPTAPDGDQARNERPNAGRIIANFVKQVPAKLDEQTKAIIGQQVKAAIGRDVAAETIERGLVRWGASGTHVSKLKQFIESEVTRSSPDLQRASRAAHLSALKADTPPDDRLPFGAAYTPEQAAAILGRSG
jgi:hypothetical protein